MAFFKIARGLSTKLPTARADGAIYFCTDTHELYIDYKNKNNTLVRVGINASQLGGAKLAHELNNSTSEIPSSALIHAIKTALEDSIGSLNSSLNNHIDNKSNPHSVTASQIGLGNVNNTSDANKPVSTAQATAIADAKKAGTDAQGTINNHKADKSNPHGVTIGQIGAAAASDLNSHTSNSTVHITSSERTTWNGKQNAITGGASTITGSNLTANRALISSGSGKVAVSATTSTELGYLSGVTSAVQTQLNAKLPTANVSGTANKVAKFTAANKVGNSNITDDGSTITLGTKVVLQGTGSSFNEGLRILPASNGWSEVFYSGNSTTEGNHDGGWLMGRRGAAGVIGAVGDFTIENNSSEGRGLTLHKNGNASIWGPTFNMGANKVSMNYDSTNECLNFVFN